MNGKDGWWEHGWMEGWVPRCHTIETGGVLGSRARLLWGEWTGPEQCSRSQSAEPDQGRQDEGEPLWCDQTLLCDPGRTIQLFCALVLPSKNTDDHSCPELPEESLRSFKHCHKGGHSHISDSRVWLVLP